jgi:purine catabolism regulator
LTNHFTLTVEDILKRKNFESCALVAGEKGLSRIVKWVHVFEVTDVGDLLNGDELILSTGFGWKENDELFISLLKQLISSNASGLCIEVGKYVQGVSKEAKDIANHNNFPIILFYKEVPFVKITQDIHSFLINQHYELISNLESYSQKLNKKLLSINNHYEILKFLQRYLNLQVIYLSDNGDYKFIPELGEEQKNKVIEEMKTNTNETKLLSQDVQVLERKYAKLFLLSQNRDLGEFESLILDRTVTALAQHLLRILYTEEKRKARDRVDT